MPKVRTFSGVLVFMLSAKGMGLTMVGGDASQLGYRTWSTHTRIRRTWAT